MRGRVFVIWSVGGFICIVLRIVFAFSFSPFLRIFILLP